MSDLYKAAQQALEALEKTTSYDIPPISQVRSSITALRAALAQQAEPVACHWHQDGDSESDMWAAGCGRHRYFTLNEGTPTENDMTHCCYCGKQLVEVPIEEGQ
jgi:hypothetical protein